MTLATFLVFLIPVVASAAQPVRQPAVVFVCEHGAAKSVIATVYFNKLARERGLPYRATFRGTDPQAELSVSALAGLRADGVEIPEGKPAASFGGGRERRDAHFCDRMHAAGVRHRLRESERLERRTGRQGVRGDSGRDSASR